MEAGKVSFNFQKADLNLLIKEVVDSFMPVARSRNLYLRCELADDIKDFDFDRDKITQVFINLIDNALKFTEQGGVTIKTALLTDFVHAAVQDTGLGIAQQDVHLLFNSFSQLERSRDKGGSGLGLIISKEIIERHKGYIWVESELGKGTIFHLFLPFQKS